MIAFHDFVIGGVTSKDFNMCNLSYAIEHICVTCEGRSDEANPKASGLIPYNLTIWNVLRNIKIYNSPLHSMSGTQYFIVPCLYLVHKQHE